MNGRSSSEFPGVFSAIAFRAMWPTMGIVAVVLVFSLSDSTYTTESFTVMLSVFAGSWLIHQGLKDRADRRAIDKASRSEPVVRGEWVAVCGKAAALQPETEGAFGDVLACRYQVSDEVRGHASPGSSRAKYLKLRYDGFHLSPTGIETEEGVVGLAGFPDLIHLEKSPLPSGMLAGGEEKAIPNTRFVPRFVTTAFILAKTRDRLNITIRYRDGEPASRGTCKSRVLRAGDQVCVFGKWNDGELLPVPSRARGLPVYAGTVEQVLERLKDDGNAFMILGACLLSVAAVLAVWFSV